MILFPFFLLFGLDRSNSQDSMLVIQNDRLDRLERDVRLLNLSLSRGSEKTSGVQIQSNRFDQGSNISTSAVARIGVRMDRLEEDLRTTTGTIEQINYRLSQINIRLDKLISDIDFRLSALEAQRVDKSNTYSEKQDSASEENGKSDLNFAPEGSLGTVSVSEIELIKKRKLGLKKQKEKLLFDQDNDYSNLPKKRALPELSQKKQYDRAFSLLQKGNYERAEVELKLFIENYSDNKLANNARYWLGETYYVRKSYKQAARIFFEGFQVNPKGPKAPDSLLKLGMSLSRLGQSQDACAAFAKVTSDFQKVSVQIKKVILRESRLNNCD